MDTQSNMRSFAVNKNSEKKKTLGTTELEF